MCSDGTFGDECDGFPDCADGTDEANCTMFACAGGTMVPGSSQCDGFPDCPDMSDEANCPTMLCDDGVTMVPETARCNGLAECPDNSDENGCAMLDCTMAAASGSMPMPTAAPGGT